MELYVLSDAALMASTTADGTDASLVYPGKIRSSSARRIMSRFFELSNVRMLRPLRGRFYAARSNVPARSRRCTWSVPGLRPRLVLARSPTDAMSNEVTAVPKISGDAVVEGHDRNRCAQLPGRNDYALTLKGNQNTVHDDVVRFSR
jgi:hypothetical protein